MLDYHIFYSSTCFQETNNVQKLEAACKQIRTHRTTILYVLKLGLSHSGKNVGWRVQEQSAEKIFEAKEEEVTGDWKKVYNEKLQNWTPRQILFRLPNADEWDAQGHMACVREMYTEGFGGKPERDHLEDLGVAKRIILKHIYNKCNEQVWMWLIWLHPYLVTLF